MYWSIVWRRLLGRSVPLLMAALLLAAGCTPALEPVARAAPPAAADVEELWSEPSDLSARDLYHGPGGAELEPAPDSTFAFLARDTSGYSWGWDVRAVSGLEWDVKYGPEARSEIVASRITWALGYHQLPTYYVERWNLVGGGQPGPQTPARFRAVPSGWRKESSWSWSRNPFVDTQPYRGLLVLMHVLNNWDLLDRNTAVYADGRAVAGPRRYVVLDLGAALGKTRLLPSGTRNDVEGFEEQGFIKGVDRSGRVKFDDVLWRHKSLLADLTPADVHWTCRRLERLTPVQWRDAFRAAHYDPQVAERFIRRLQDKVRLGLALGDSRAVAGVTRP